MRTITVRLEDEEYENIKLLSKQTGITISALVKQGLQLRKRQLTGANENINMFENN